jgi:hypothetical protein
MRQGEGTSPAVRLREFSPGDIVSLTGASSDGKPLFFGETNKATGFALLYKSEHDFINNGNWVCAAALSHQVNRGIRKVRPCTDSE